MKMRMTIILIVGLSWRIIDGRPHRNEPGCWYEGKRYQESEVVNTTEPCLRCRCNEGSLRCRLRVCPRLPSPPPSGCTTRSPRDNACCAELVCGDSHESNVTARRDPSKDIRSHDNGCLHEGVRYAPGSAMMGSRRCEYCYCISGNRRCLRPRCLLPLAGCTPLYEPHSCCPVAYNCTNSAHHSVPSLGSSSFGNGCRVDSRTYDEGEMVRDIAHKSECDNCFCAMGGVRCVPLSCAPPLQGCMPIVREGHCCPSTYNCSGSIEVKAAQNYASYAFISKDYAKFRKETNFFSMDTNDPNDEEPKNSEQEEFHEDYDEYETIVNSTVEGRGHKTHQPQSSSILFTLETPIKSRTIEINPETTENFPLVESTTISEQISTTTLTNEPTTITRHETETMNNEIPTETMDYEKSSTTQQETTLTIEDSTIFETTEISETSNFDTTRINDNYESTTIETTIFDDFVTFSDQTESILFSKNENRTELPISENSTIEIVAEESSDHTTILVPTMTTTIRDKPKNNHLITRGGLEIIGATINCSESSEISSNFSNDGLSIEKDNSEKFSDDTRDDVLSMNVTLSRNVSVAPVRGVTTNPVRSIPPDIEAILNITRKKGDDYDYEYSQPTIPPSLPNVRIIPFVVEDAVVKEEEENPDPVTNYPMGSVGLSPPELGPTVAGTMANFYDIATQENHFSPPSETEGGFIPRQPPYFDPLYNPTDLNMEIHTGATVVPADITNPYRKSDEQATNCRVENRDFSHGDVIPNSGHCIICICYYGDVTCSDEKCPPLKIGCTRIENEKNCCGKIVCVDSDESPTLLLDRSDPAADSPRQPIPAIDVVVSPDPFVDVITTEQTPDFPFLIEDMLPYLADGHPKKSQTTPMTPSTLESKVHGHYQLEPDENFPPVTNVDDFYVINQQPSKTFKNHKPSNIFHSTPKNLTEITSKKSQTSVATYKKNSQPNNSDEFPNYDDSKNSSSITFENVFAILFSENSENAKNSKNFTETRNESEFNDFTSIGIAESNDKIVDSSTSWGKIVEMEKEMTTTERTTNLNVNSFTTGSSDNDMATSVNSLLKLAGCNIYGRMYRVGRIITELSSPCLECRCTEVGVQCKQLEC